MAEHRDPESLCTPRSTCWRGALRVLSESGAGCVLLSLLVLTSCAGPSTVCTTEPADGPVTNAHAGTRATERRVAIVVGNGAYSGESELPNAPRDATAMAQLLASLDFELVGGRALLNADRSALEDGLIDFGRSLEGTPESQTTVALFFYAGHAIQRRGENYLVPVGATVHSERDIEREMVGLDVVMRELGSASGVRIVVLDACRNDPFVAQSARGMAVETVGLAPQEAPAGTVVAYSTAPGRTAADSVAFSEHSPYTAAMLAAMGRVGLRLEDVFMEVRNRVDRSTGGAQTPWEHSSLLQPFYFRPVASGGASLEEQCARGEPTACRRLGDREEAAGRPYHAVAYFADGCGTADAQSCLDFARLREELDMAEAPSVVLARARAACERGHAPGCTAVGRALEHGEGEARDYQAAAAAYERACELGDGYGCRYLGDLYAHARGVLRDGERALSLLRTSCERGVQDGCAGVGYLYEQGIGVPTDLPRAVAIYREACAHGSGRACSNLGALHDEGRGVPNDPEHARLLYERACDRGHVHACSNLAWHVAEGVGAERDDARALELYEQACAEHDVHACTNLGWFVQHGRSTEVDLARARTLYESACDQVETVGCFNLGGLYLAGDGVAADAALAAGLFERACQAGTAAACGALASLYASGQGVTRDPPRALTLHEQACTGGALASCTTLGTTLASGRGVPRDYTRARALFTRACDGGHAPGCFNLGLLLANGLGTERDEPAAQALYDRACTAGVQAACAALGR